MKTKKPRRHSNVAEVTSIPYFESDEAAAEFWDKHEFTEFPEFVEKLGKLLKARQGENKKLIALKVEPSLLGAIKAVAAAKGLGYSALIRMWLLERLQAERGRYLGRARPG